jgi:hypothetical protein
LRDHTGEGYYAGRYRWAMVSYSSFAIGWTSLKWERPFIEEIAQSRGCHDVYQILNHKIGTEKFILEVTCQSRKQPLALV